MKKMEDLRETIGDVNKQFKNADLTTYVLIEPPR
jgi:arsenite-transporting ATPase